MRSPDNTVTMRPRVGHIQFLNCLPLYYGLVNGNGILDVDFVKGTPTDLNEMISCGELDIGPVSSVEYARHAGDLLLLPGPTVSCRGAVRSITLVSRCPLEALHGRRIGLTSASATSRVLLKIILSRKYGIVPEYFSFGDSLGEALSKGDAALLIGDSALHNLSPPDGMHLYDLGEEWHSFTGEGMVFAVWVVRRDFAAARPDLVSHVLALFRESTDYFRRNISTIAADASRWEPFSQLFLEEYFKTLSFDFNADLRHALTFFYREACSIGELDNPAHLDFFQEPALQARERGGSFL